MAHSLLRRTAVVSLALPFLYLGTASATFLYRLHAENSARAGKALATTRPPTAASRILIFSPHPDDETLGCGGLIQQARSAGAVVQVVFITNGDGFRVAVERQLHQLHVGPRDYVQFADLRQQETYRALANLGVERQSISFLGYPDRGLLPLWTSHWSPQALYRSPYTHCDHSPYTVAWRDDSAYCGASLLGDIKALMEQSRPTDVYVTHPSDDHPDHTAASSFVTLAWQELREGRSDWANKCQLHYYLVHRGDWPAPQGPYEADSLVPPTEMTSLDTRWQSRPLRPDQVARKERSILTYESQTSIMKRFLLSFARRNELFGDLDTPTVPRVPNGSIVPDGNVDDWRGLAPVVLDPVNDNLLRDFQAGGDIMAVYACRDATTLYVRVDTSRPVSRRVQFRMGIRFFGDRAGADGGGVYAASIGPGTAANPPDVRACVRGNRVEIAVPLEQIGFARRIALDVDTSFAGILVDRTGYRFMTL